MLHTQWAGRWLLQGLLGLAAWWPSWTQKVLAAWALAMRAGTLPWRKWHPGPTDYDWRLPGLVMQAPTAALPKPTFEGLGPDFVKQPVLVPGLSLCM